MLLCFVALPSFEEGSEKRYEGAIVLETEEVITGTFYFDEKKDLLYQKLDSRWVSFPVFKIKSLHFYDVEEHINRQFIKIIADKSISKFPYQLYEVVVSGEMKILRKRKAHDYPVSDGEWKLTKEEETVYNYHYYVFWDDIMYDTSRFYKEVYPKLGREDAVIAAEVVKAEDFNMRELSSVIQFVECYNKLAKLHY